MLDTGKVFISHAHEDNNICQDLVRMLEHWGVRHWIDFANHDYTQPLSATIADALNRCSAFIRIATTATHASTWMERERQLFRDQQTVSREPRPYINVVLDGYTPDALDAEYLYIDGRGQPQAMWLDGIRKALRKEMGWIVFDTDDRDYLWWIGEYQQGYVVSADRRPKRDWLTLHRAYCRFIRDINANGATRYEPGAFCERDFIKICAENRSELEQWARQHVDATAELSTGCNCIVWGTA